MHACFMTNNLAHLAPFSPKAVFAMQRQHTIFQVLTSRLETLSRKRQSALDGPVGLGIWAVAKFKLLTLDECVNFGLFPSLG